MIAIGFAGDNEEGSKGARMHQADWQYQCAHRPIQALSHCPPPYHIGPRQSPGQSGSLATDAITRRQYAQAHHLMTPLFRRPATILVIGNVTLGGLPGTHRCSGISSPRSSLYFESIQGYPYH